MIDRATLMAWDRDHVWHPFTQAQTAPDPIPLVRAEGAWLTDIDGKQYLDLISSWWVTLHGHGQPEVADAIAEQARTMDHVMFAGHTHQPAAELSRRLADVLPDGLNRVFFSDDGSTAVEVALKAALQFQRNVGARQRSRFLAFDGGYHGDTVGSMSVGASSSFFDAFTDMMFPVDVLPVAAHWQGAEDIEAREAEALDQLDRHLAAHGADTCAAIIEPLLQGAGGMRMHRAEFLAAVVERLRAHDILVIFDEVATGFGRTGGLFACETSGVAPDLICLSKGLTAGFLPMAVTVVHDRIFDAFLGDSVDQAFLHGHSFTANPLGCAAALASLKLLVAEQGVKQRRRIAEQHAAGLARLAESPLVSRVRQVGTVAAFDVDTGEAGGYRAAVGPWLKTRFMARGLIIRPLGNVVYLMPPLCTTAAELTDAYEAIGAVLAELAASPAEASRG